MEIKIKKAENIDECKECNRMLAELIDYEIEFDNSMIKRSNIENHYERILNKEDVILYLAKNGEETVGYITAYVNTPKHSKESFVNIMNLYVKSKYRSKGIGKLLISEVEKWAKNNFSILTLELDCFIDNKTAMEFYGKLNYKPIRMKMRKRLD